MVEWLLENTPPTDGNLYDWMHVRAQVVKTNNIQLIADNNGASPTMSGFYGSRNLFIRYRSEDESSPLLCMLPGNETFIYYPMSTSIDIVGTSSSSNGNRIQPMTDTQQNMQCLAFKIIQPPSVPIGYMNVTIDLNIWKVNQPSLPAGTTLKFYVQLFQASHSDFSDETPILGELTYDRFNVILVDPDPTTNTVQTNKQVCRLNILVGGSPPDSTITTYYRFKISRTNTTTDPTKILFDEITLTATLFDAFM